MSTGIDLSVVVPAFNEELRLPAMLADLGEFLAGWSGTAEVVVVDDGSTDRTAEVARTTGSSLPGLQVVSYQPNRGKGCAVRTGLLLATGSVRLFLDADGATPAAEIPKLLDALRSGCDVAIGSIGLPEADVVVAQRRLRVLAGTVGNAAIRWMLLPGIYDTQRGCKAVRASAVPLVVEPLTADGFGFDIEMLALARSAGLDVCEVPIRWQHIPGASLTLHSYLAVLRDVIRLRRRVGRLTARSASTPAPSQPSGSDE